MAKTVAEVSATCEALSGLLGSTRQEVADLGAENRKFAEMLQAAREEAARSREESIHSRRQLDEARETGRQQEKAIAELRQEIAVLRQQLQDHVAQYQEWDRRRWGLITVLIGAVFSLASGLIVTLAKK